MSPEEVADLAMLVKKIMTGRKDWTETELQMYKNHPDLIENILKNEAKKR